MKRFTQALLFLPIEVGRASLKTLSQRQDLLRLEAITQAELHFVITGVIRAKSRIDLCVTTQVLSERSVHTEAQARRRALIFDLPIKVTRTRDIDRLFIREGLNQIGRCVSIETDML